MQIHIVMIIIRMNEINEQIILYNQVLKEILKDAQFVIAWN